MATVSWSPTTSATDLQKIWRIVQLQLALAFNFVTEEWNLLTNKVPRMRINLSARQMILPLDLKEDYGVASIAEGGWEAVPSSPTAVDSEFTWITLHGRFSTSRTARQLDSGGNRAAMVARQIRWQGTKKLQSIKRRVGDYFYGYSTGTIFVVAGVSTDTITVDDMYSESGLGSADYNKHLKRIVKAGDRLAIFNGSTLRGTAAVDSVHASNATFDFASGTTPGSTAANDLIKFANTVEDNDATHTDHNRGLTGMLDILKSTTVQNVSGSTHDEWNVGHSSSTAGKFGTIELRNMKNGIMNFGGLEMDQVLYTQGIENDLIASLRGGLRFTNAFSLEIDGAPKAKGVDLMSTQRVLPGYAIGFNRSGSMARINLLEAVSEPGWNDAEKIPNRAGFVFPMDWPLQVVYKNRKSFAYESSKTEQ